MNVFSLPRELPLERPKDHVIDLVSRSSPMNRPLYRISAAQQKEIMTQVNELLEKGLIQPSSSPFCSCAACLKKGWFMANVHRL